MPRGGPRPKYRWDRVQVGTKEYQTIEVDGYTLVVGKRDRPEDWPTGEVPVYARLPWRWAVYLGGDMVRMGNGWADHAARGAAMHAKRQHMEVMLAWLAAAQWFAGELETGEERKV